MSCQGGAAGEGLLAVGVWTLVRSLAGVDAAMPSQGAGVTEGLSRSEWMYPEQRSYLATSLAHVRLVTGVDTCVYSQGRPLDELLATVGPLAHMGSLAAVDAF